MWCFFLDLAFFFLRNINAMFYRKEIRKTKQQTTNGIYFSILGRVAFLQFWMPIIHCTEKEWLLVQLLTKTKKYFDICISYFTIPCFYQYVLWSWRSHKVYLIYWHEAQFSSMQIQVPQGKQCNKTYCKTKS